MKVPSAVPDVSLDDKSVSQDKTIKVSKGVQQDKSKDIAAKNKEKELIIKARLKEKDKRDKEKAKEKEKKEKDKEKAKKKAEAKALAKEARKRKREAIANGEEPAPKKSSGGLNKLMNLSDELAAIMGCSQDTRCMVCRRQLTYFLC